MKKIQSAFLNIAPIGHGKPGSTIRGFNGYQKRLVHQLVRAEYPDIVSISRQDFIQLVPFDQEREDLLLAKKCQAMERNLIQQIGMRWIIEALCTKVDTVLNPENMSPISSAAVFRDILMEEFPADEDSVQERARRVQSLSDESTILLRHNLILHLIYLYRCFIGPLPDQVEEFQSVMGLLFPLIIDTKYLADVLNQNSPRYRSSLEEIDQELSKNPSPLIGMLSLSPRCLTWLSHE